MRIDAMFESNIRRTTSGCALRGFAVFEAFSSEDKGMRPTRVTKNQLAKDQ